MNEDMKKQLKEKFGDMIKFDEPLSKHCTFKIGGPAEVYVEPKTNEDLVEVFRFVREHELPYFILGGGSNVLLPDEGIEGVVINPRNRDLKIEGESVTAGAGVVLAKLANETAKAGLTGLEWGIAVPGNVGGAVRGNAGAFGGEIKDTLVEAKVFDGKELSTLSNKELEFSYRSSRIKKNGGTEIVIEASFKLAPADSEECTATVKKFLAKKFEAQPMGELCAGCLFKNVEVDKDKNLVPPSKGEPTEKFLKEVPADFWEKGKVPAGWLIDNLGLKGYEKNGIKVSEKHANFLVNTGEGNAKAVKEMVEDIKEKVYSAYGVHLEEEVQFV